MEPPVDGSPFNNAGGIRPPKREWRPDRTKGSSLNVTHHHFIWYVDLNSNDYYVLSDSAGEKQGVAAQTWSGVAFELQVEEGIFNALQTLPSPGWSIRQRT